MVEAEVEMDIKPELRSIEAEVEPDIRRELRLIEFGEWVDLAIREFGAVVIGGRQIVAATVIAGTIIGFAVSDRFGLTLPLIALTGGVLMSIFSGEEPQKILREIDWSTIFFLAGLFVIINGMDKTGIIEMLSTAISSLIQRWSLNMPISIMWFSALPSSIVDNIPLTATFAPLVKDWVMEGGVTSTWWGLVIGANLGGCLTPIGTPSNIVALGVAEREGHPIPIGRFFKICFGVTMVHLVISTLYIYVMYSLL